MQTGVEHDEVVTGTQLWLVLMKAFQAVSAYAQSTLVESGLGDSDFRVLEALLHKGALPVNDIGQKVFLTPGAISTAVERLHAKGWVTRQDSKKDRRIRLVDLTPAGRTLIEREFRKHARQMNLLGEELSPKQRRQLARSLKAFGKAAQGKGAQADVVRGRKTPASAPDIEREMEPEAAALSAPARGRKKSL